MWDRFSKRILVAFMVPYRYHSTDNRWVPPHQQGLSLQQGDGVLRGEKVERRTTIATDPGSHCFTGDRGRKDPGNGCGACTAGQGLHVRLGVWLDSSLIWAGLSDLPHVFSSSSSCFSASQICANLDSAIVSTKNYVAELQENVPRPIKRYDIVEKRLEVSWFCWIYISRIMKNFQFKTYAAVMHPDNYFILQPTWELWDKWVDLHWFSSVLSHIVTNNYCHVNN